MPMPSRLHQQEYRQKICEADERIRRAEVVWNVTQTEFPDANFDEAALRENMRQTAEDWPATRQGAPERQWREEVLERRRETALHGAVRHQRVTYHRDGSNADCVTELAAAAGGMKLRSATAWDSANALTITSLRSDSQSNYTYIERDTGWRKVEGLFLYANPVFALFSRWNDAIVDETDETVTWERRHLTDDPTVVSITFSKTHWRPLEIIKKDWRVAERIFSRRVVEDYRQFANDAWFPARVTEFAHGNCVEPREVITHELEMLRLNDEADVSSLHPLVAPGTQVSDFRFGSVNPFDRQFKQESPLDYTATGELPTEAQAQAMRANQQRRERGKRFFRTIITGRNRHAAPR